MMNFGYGMLGCARGPFMMIGLVILGIIGVVLLVKYLNKSGKTPMQMADNTALNVLNERYAKGEVSEEDYTKIKEGLKK